MNESLPDMFKIGPNNEQPAHILGGCFLPGGFDDEGDNSVLVGHNDVTGIVGKSSGNGLDGFVKEVHRPILESSHAHDEAAYETVDSVAKVCEIFRLNGKDLGVGLIILSE